MYYNDVTKNINGITYNTAIDCMIGESTSDRHDKNHYTIYLFRCIENGDYYLFNEPGNSRGIRVISDENAKYWAKNNVRELDYRSEFEVAPTLPKSVRVRVYQILTKYRQHDYGPYSLLDNHTRGYWNWRNNFEWEMEKYERAKDKGQGNIPEDLERLEKLTAEDIISVLDAVDAGEIL